MPVHMKQGLKYVASLYETVYSEPRINDIKQF
jgi:hypothetical protein